MEATKGIKPATPLPWTVNPRWNDHNHAVQIDSAEIHSIAGAFYLGGAGPAKENALYIVHACNNYGRLVEALRELVARCDGEEGVRADGSNIQTFAASAILHQLGEA